MNVLVVDDEADNRYLLTSLLPSLGYQVGEAANGQIALDMLNEGAWDLVVSDILMPVMDGFQLCREIRSQKRFRDLPFIFYTATYVDQKDEDFALKLGADRFFRKPMDPKEFLGHIQALVDEAARRRGGRKPRVEADEKEILKLYNERLIRKLEHKMLDLEKEIKDRKKVEVALRESEEKFRSFYENATVGIYRTSPDGRIFMANPTLLRTLGFDSLDDLTQRNLAAEGFEPAYPRRDFEKRVESEGKVVGMESAWKRKDGSMVHIRESSYLVRDNNEKPLYYEGIIEDVSERKQLGDRLRQSETYFQALIDTSPDAILTIDLAGRLTYASRKAYEMFGVSSEANVIGTSIGQWLEPEEKGKYLERMKDLFSGKGRPETRTYRLRRSDGTSFWGELSSAPLSGVDGRLSGLLIVCRDISERVRSAEALQESEKKYRSLVSKSPDGIFVIDRQEKFLSVNEAMCDNLHYSEDELLSMTLWDIIPEEFVDQHKKRLALLLRGEIPNEAMEYQVRGKDGTIHFIEVRSVPYFRGQDVIGFQGIARDIGYRKRAEEERNQNHIRLQKSLESTVGAMAATVELRDPYTAGHQRRVADLAYAIAVDMRLAAPQVEGVRLASGIHDVGKITVPAEILTKPTRLSAIEFNLIKSHSQCGYDILKDIEFPWPIARMILEHHERINGSGYPNALAGEHLLLESKIIMVADTVEAMASHRPYRASLGIDAALDEIAKNKGILFDPDVVDACVALFREKGFVLPT